ncbi:hypothetical protein G6038_09815 [Rhodococcus sp. 14C212]|uniref:hypothetical protein n=1 Tax=Rhodococcus sp. 14C212 TaxID=2711209 RepID=UPI0013E9C92C|nr:hypothetical protein [Rhodococcus sp. 14C212]NGP05770.1 hypothetical protein [Rhodococcus sp. 14C212]
MTTEIRWARTLAAPAGEDLNGSPPTNVLGEPNAYTYAIHDATPSITVKDFGCSYKGLAGLLGSAFAGDKVDLDAFKNADVLAFEHNGDSPAPSGGWESCEWKFSDSENSLVVRWDAGTSAPRDAHVVANGSIRGDEFCAFFNVPESDLLQVNTGVDSAKKAVVSFLLFKVRPEIHVHDESFEVAINLTVTSPDVDAIGVLVHETALEMS